ncbi:maestro heat-like repeat-containing protein family member 1 isoform X3 [Dasypus novemcinctus]|uniref:maestro heat-like repeat-containing protein family member 1 isoform X3 n=1 Tax=Dasypus novemcinctus TaxID=9361 RepID=UPI00265F143B|nr:maestro heat-like repeat-containing protein family member 1 isoform X3 [Dasypus novemcinctus]
MAKSYVKKLSSTLMDAITDKDPLVQEQVYNALCALGESQPELTLSACQEHLRQQEKLAHPHRTMILKAMEAVVSSHLGRLDQSTAKAVILLASNEMTKVKELVGDWQQAASSVLVAVGRRFINEVMEELLGKFVPGVLPHCCVVQTLASLSVSNAFGTVPFLPAILSTLLPMLGLAKQDATRAVFCCALQSFSESTLEYLANLDQAPDPTVRKDAFSSDIFSAYEVLFTQWLQSREAKLRLAVVQALGPMSHLLPNEKLEEQLPKLIPGVLSLYKKHAEAVHVSKSLGQILEASVSVGSRTLEVQLDALLAALHAQICVPVELSSPSVVSNQKEVLRCFTVLACCAPDRLLAFLLPKLDTSHERIRVGTLQVLRHTINAAAAQMEVKKPFILSSMRLPLLDTNNKVKRAVVQVISAMAHHGYLEQPGGKVMVEYIVQQCALGPELEKSESPGPGGEDPAPDSVRSISVSTLYLLSSTVDRMDRVLWPYLLEFLTPAPFTQALSPLCRSLAHLALKRREAGADTFLIQYDGNANLPSPYAITTRLLVMSASPYLGDGRGAASLRLLSILHHDVHPQLGQHWRATLGRLVELLDGWRAVPEHTAETLAQEEWEDKLLTFLQDTLTIVSDNMWVCQLSLEMCKQLPCYTGTPREKMFLYKCIGSVLAAVSSKDVVRKRLQELLEAARYQEEAERQGLAACFGICAVSHLDDTLAQLADFVRSDVFRKSIGIFSLFKPGSALCPEPPTGSLAGAQPRVPCVVRALPVPLTPQDRNENEVEKVKSALVLCYGHVAARAPRELVLARAESDILCNMFQYFNSKDPTLKLCLVQSVRMVSHALCSSPQASAFHCAQKAELVAQMMELIKAEPLDALRTPLRKEAMAACAYLVSLEPALEEQMRADVARGCLHSILALPPEPAGDGTSGLEALHMDTARSLEGLLMGLLRRDLTPRGLQVMVEHLIPWIKSPRGHERERALGVSACLLRFSLEHLHVSALVPFHNLGLLVGLFSPRCADLRPATRQEAVGCVHSLLYLQLGYEGFARDYRDDVAERLLALRDGLVHPDPAVLFHTCHSVAQIIGKRLPPDQLISLLLTLFESLGDPDKNCARAAAVMINCLLKERGAVLLEKVPEIVSVLRSKLQEPLEEHVLKAAQHSVYLLACQHCAAVVTSLLGSPLPFDSVTCTLWRALAVSPGLTAQVLELLLEKMCRDVPFKESRPFLLSSAPGRVATVLPLAATSALLEVLACPAAGPAVLERYADLFAGLLLRLSCSVGVQLPRSLQAKDRRGAGTPPATRALEPCSLAVDALQAMLLRAGSEEVVKLVEREGGWELLRTSEGHEEGVARLASAMAKHAGPRLPLAMKALVSTQSCVYEVQRVTSTAFLAELLRSNVAKDLLLLESLLDNLAARQKDASASVRRLVLRGLANVATGSPDKVRAHSPQLLSAMIAGLDDADEPHGPVVLEAMEGLARLLALLEPGELRSVLLHVAIRIRPFFDSENAELRRAAFGLFGHLHRACHGDCEDVFLEQAVGGLAPLLLHLRDPQAPVVSACRFALRMCGPNLECAELEAAFQKHLQEGRGPHLGEFFNVATKHLMHRFPDALGRLLSTSLFYFKSPWEGVRAAAPMLVGFLVLHADSESTPQVDLEQLLAALQLLLKDPAPAVRMSAAEALGRLVKFA